MSLTGNIGLQCVQSSLGGQSAYDADDAPAVDRCNAHGSRCAVDTAYLKFDLALDEQSVDDAIVEGGLSIVKKMPYNVVFSGAGFRGSEHVEWVTS